GRYSTAGRPIQRTSRNEQDQEAQLAAAEQGKATVPASLVFHTDHGRIVRGGGRIRPDMFVTPDTFTTAERAFIRMLGNKVPVYWDARAGYALELKAAGKLTDPNFTVSDAMVDEVLRRLRARGGTASGSTAAGHRVQPHGRHKQKIPKPLTPTVGPDDRPPPWVSEVGVLFLAVRDDAIRPLAQMLHDTRSVQPEHVVLHLSGVQGQEALGPL